MNKSTRLKQKGTVLILSMIFLLMISALAISTATINSSIINYSNEEISLSGNNDLFFNRSSIENIPVGFVPEIVLYYDPTSYSEVTL